MIKALQVAKFILWRAAESGISISNLHLQKILYFAQGFCLRHTNVPLFPENIQAWQYGPVVDEVYRHYKEYGSNAITEVVGRNVEGLTNFEIKILEVVTDTFARENPWTLVDITHSQMPWKISYKEGQKNVIPIGLIQTQFERRGIDG